MHMMWTQIDHDENDVRPVRGPLAVTEQLIVSDVMEVQTPVALKRRILTPDAIHVADEFAEAVLPLKIPMLDFIFF